MAKLTKREAATHSAAVDLLAGKRDGGRLLLHEREFVLEHWQPSAQAVTDDQAHFTPPAWAGAVAASSVSAGRVLDLGAGIGALSYALWQRNPGLEIVAVEKNPEFVAVGWRVLPEAEWVEGDIFDLSLLHALGEFDEVVANPPYSRKAGPAWLRYNTGNQALMALEVALCVSRTATFILPRPLVDWEYCGVTRYRQTPPGQDLLRFRGRVEGVALGPANFSPDAPFKNTSIPNELAIAWVKERLALPPLEEK